MLQLNESGASPLRYLYRAHEVGSNGAVSVTDLQNGTSKVLVQFSHWERMDGLRWTPWGSILTAEEAVPALPDPDWPAAQLGLLYEITLDPSDPSVALSVDVRPALGSRLFEGIAVDSGGNVYTADENANGSIYRFVSDTMSDLSSGTLYALKVTDSSRTGVAQWVELTPGVGGVATDPRVNSRAAALEASATTWNRPEDMELAGNLLYVAITGEDKVIAIDIGGTSPQVQEFVVRGQNAPATGSATFEHPDNLASDPLGNIYIVEDNSPGDIWAATPDLDSDGLADFVGLFASLSTSGAEPTGLYFEPGANPRVAYLNVQHAADQNDMTLVISEE